VIENEKLRGIFGDHLRRFSSLLVQAGHVTDSPQKNASGSKVSQKGNRGSSKLPAKNLTLLSSLFCLLTKDPESVFKDGQYPAKD